MSLRNQPYFLLNTKELLSNQNLLDCDATSIGVYIFLLCILHKSKEYGKFTLKAKDKIYNSQLENFAVALSRPMPFCAEEIANGLSELIENKIIYVDNDSLCHKRMIQAAELSDKRAKSGSRGGKSVRNSQTRKLYNEPGFLYLIKDINANNVFKVGISKTPHKWLLAIANKLHKNLALVYTIETEDMGSLEDAVLMALNGHRDGEWVFGFSQAKLIELIDIFRKRQLNEGATNNG